MKAVVLAAGRGCRLKPLTDDVPKPLIEIDGKPILAYSFDKLIDLGIKTAVVVVGYKRNEISNHFGDSYRGLRLNYVVQHERKGLAHAVMMAENIIEYDFIVMNGDNIYRGNLADAINQHYIADVDLTFLVDKVSHEVAKTGAVCDFEGSKLIGLVEKPGNPPSNTVPTAFYILPPEIFHACKLIKPSERGEYELTDAIDILIHAGYTTQTVPFEGWKININTKEDLLEAKERVTGFS